MKSGETGGAQSTRRALRLLSLIGSSSSGTSILELCERSGLTRPTVYRLVAVLAEEGFLRSGDDGRNYRLGPAFLELAQSSWSSFDLRGAAAFELERLGNVAASSGVKGAAIRLMLRVEDRLVCIEMVEPTGDGGQGVGYVEPLAVSAAGIAIAAFSSVESVPPGAFKASDLHLARARFYALWQTEPDGRWSVAAPVFNETGRAVAAISITAPAHRFGIDDAHAFAPEIIEAARQTSRAAGGYPFALAPEIAPEPDGHAKIECLHRGGDLNGDSPVIGADGSQHFWIDVLGPSLFSLDTATGLFRSFEMPDVIGALVPMGEGQLLAGFTSSIASIDAATGAVSARVTINGIPPGSRINGGGVDGARRLWFGVIDPTLPDGNGRLVRVERDGQRLDELEGLSLPNGIGWSPRGETLYVVDSARKEIFGFDYDPATGAVGTRRRIADLAGYAGRPAGLAVDRSGRLWTTLWDGWRLLCLGPDGSVIEEIVVPVPRPSDLAIARAGPPRVIFTSARARLTAAQISQAPLSGGLFAYRLPAGDA